ncbi:MAG TPA: hypothetical protein VE269_02220 [Gaiellaceae bacterium]|nr:hypothetical protein [Gaiellaceae bacterium]
MSDQENLRENEAEEQREEAAEVEESDVEAHGGPKSGTGGGGDTYAPVPPAVA